MANPGRSYRSGGIGKNEAARAFDLMARAVRNSGLSLTTTRYFDKNNPKDIELRSRFEAEREIDALFAHDNYKPLPMSWLKVETDEAGVSRVREDKIDVAKANR